MIIKGAWVSKWGGLMIKVDGKNELVHIHPGDLIGTYLFGEVEKKRTRRWFKPIKTPGVT